MIYKIFNHHTKQVYIGSTILKLETRLSQHKNACANFQNGKGKYLTSFELFDKINSQYTDEHPIIEKFYTLRIIYVCIAIGLGVNAAPQAYTSIYNLIQRNKSFLFERCLKSAQIRR